METQPHSPPPSPEALKQGYEPASLRFRAVVVFVICFALAGLFLHFVVWGMMQRLLAHDRAADVPQSAVANLPAPSNDAPALQPSPAHDTLDAQDMAKMHERENIVFEHMGWRTDPGKAAAGIPEDVIAAVLARPATQAGQPGDAAGAPAPAGGNGGPP